MEMLFGLMVIEECEYKMKNPMLLSNEEFDLNVLDYSNMYQSIKRDGVRVEIINNNLIGRSLKPFRNIKLNQYFKNNLNFKNEIIEGEIYNHKVPCREMSGICNSLDKDISEGTKIYIFGLYDKELSFEDRYKKLKTLIKDNDKIELVSQVKCNNSEEAIKFFNDSLELGYEGIVLMDGSKKYKENRVTIQEHIGFKVKPHKEVDLLILDVQERFINTNESLINELGYKYKRNTVDSKEATGVAATFLCKMDNGEETRVTITGDEEYRREIWKNKEKYKGMYAVVKRMDYGEKNKLLHSRLIDIKVK